MGENLLKEIQLLIKTLPPRDIPWGEKFVKDRRFESLRDLVNSAVKVDKKRVADGKDSRVKDSAGLATLQVKVDKYCALLGIPEEEDDDLDDFYPLVTWDEYD